MDTTIKSGSDQDEGLNEEISALKEQVEQLKAENARLRKALLKASTSHPKMSSKLRDALYE